MKARAGQGGIDGVRIPAWASGSIGSDLVAKSAVDGYTLLLQLQEVKEKFAALGADTAPMTTEQFALHLRAEIAKVAKAIKDSGAKAE